MSRIRLIIQYDGTDYVGWQTQPNGIAVQQKIEEELHRITGEDITLHASGRTDSGVHARAQVAHFDTDSRISEDKFAYALNAYLPEDIRIIYSGSAENFHARFDVKKKHYRYQIWNAAHMDPFMKNTALHVHSFLDVEKMNAAAKLILGEHDFKAFKSVGVELKSTVREIFSSSWKQEGALITYDVSGSGFMYNMVRILVGTMIEIGKGQREKESILEALEKGERDLLGATAPAKGLFLYRVEYPNFDTEDYMQSAIEERR